MDETFEVPEMSAAEIEGRLNAQRHALQWLLLHVRSVKTTSAHCSMN